MTFTANIPTTGQSLGVTKQPIQDNFTNYFNVLSQDHVAPNLTGQGKHKKISLTNQTAAVPSAGVSEVVIYSTTTLGISSPLYKRDDLATGTIWPLAPMKAFAMVTSTGAAGAQTLTSSYNITLCSRTGNVWTFTITNAMKSATSYGIFGIVSAGDILTFAPINSTSFSFNTNAAATGAATIFNAFVVESN